MTTNESKQSPALTELEKPLYASWRIPGNETEHLLSVSLSADGHGQWSDIGHVEIVSQLFDTVEVKHVDPPGRFLYRYDNEFPANGKVVAVEDDAASNFEKALGLNKIEVFASDCVRKFSTSDFRRNGVCLLYTSPSPRDRG